jgi:hypothetical protein
MNNPEIDNYCDNEVDMWKRKYEEERAIVDRIWKILGNPTYEQLGGKSIYELVEELKARAENAEYVYLVKSRAIKILEN